MTAEERAASVCAEMASGPLILDAPFDEWVQGKVATAIRAAERAAAERMRERCVEAILEMPAPYDLPDRTTANHLHAAIDAIRALSLEES